MGLYNFRHYFWAERLSRLYGPKPRMTLIIAQDLKIDIEHRFPQRPDYHLLFELLGKTTHAGGAHLFRTSLVQALRTRKE